jgi:hypothetical protein
VALWVYFAGLRCGFAVAMFDGVWFFLNLFDFVPMVMSFMQWSWWVCVGQWKIWWWWVFG